MQITTHLNGRQWIAAVEGDRTRQATGRTEAEAVGYLVNRERERYPEDIALQGQVMNWRASGQGAGALGAQVMASGTVQIRRLPIVAQANGTDR